MDTLSLSDFALILGVNSITFSLVLLLLTYFPERRSIVRHLGIVREHWFSAVILVALGWASVVIMAFAVAVLSLMFRGDPGVTMDYADR